MLNLLFPRICNGCNTPLLQAETIICTSCRHNLPLLCYHRNDNTALKDVFYGRIPLHQATTLLQFQKGGVTQQILHNLKYRGQHKISNFFGMWLGAELVEQEAYKAIDLVIPVPLHKQKHKKRGYNQVSGFGYEIAKSLGVPFREDLLLKVSKTHSQVFKKRFTRFNTEEIFSLERPQDIDNKHVLLVDDIITTGATIEHCAQQLFKAKNVTLSIATIAMA